MYCISVCEKLKHKKPRKHQEPLDFLAYPMTKDSVEWSTWQNTSTEQNREEKIIRNFS